MEFKNDTLYMVPLGGCGEFGGNLTLYGWNGKWLMLDCGLGFDRQELVPGLERQLILPDPSFIAARREELVGCVITHAHEDHVGGLPYLWDLFRCPVYLSPFAARVMGERAYELGKEIDHHLVEAGDVLKLGPFTCRMLGVTHSIPEAMMVAVETPAGTIVHTGDWKLDDDPLIGELTEIDALKEIGAKGVLAVVGDSTNATIEGESGDEGSVCDGLISLFSTLEKRIVVTMMARHIGRMVSIIDAAHECGREVALVGRSLWTMEHIARDLGYFEDMPKFMNPKQIMRLPRDRVVMIVTGTQAEPNAALARMSLSEHPTARVEPGDTVVFSARVIPGSETAIAAVQNRFRDRGVAVVTKDYPNIYSSGHPCRGEMRKLYGWLKPKWVLPVHGEALQQEAHAGLAAEMGAKTLIPANGQVIRLAAGVAEVVGNVPVGHLAIRSVASESGFSYRLDKKIA